MMDILGIDVSKAQLSLALLQGDSIARKAVNNSSSGIKQLLAWLRNRKARNLHACLEATGTYGELVAEHLHDAGFTVSVVNPIQIKAFGRSAMVRTKTDGVDALLIAQFCRAQKPPAWVAPPEKVRDFRALMRRREALVDIITAEGNRLEAASAKEVRRSIRAVLKAVKAELAVLEEQISHHVDSDPDLRELVDRLDELPGVARLTAMKMLAETNSFTVCDTARQIVAYAGLNPCHYQSGTIVRRQRISKIGNGKLRKALFYAALSAKNHSRYFRPFVERLQGAGKRPMVIITAIMRKLLILAHALATKGTRFDPSLAA
jgi:transposase